MEPLSSVKRKAYLILLIFAFVIFTPLLIFYAMGYRFDENAEVKKTGGVFVAINVPYAEVYIDRISTKENSLLRKNVLIQNVEPGKHLIFVGKEGYRSWAKEVEIFPERVTEVHANLYPVNIELIPLEKDNELNAEEKDEIRKLINSRELMSRTRDFKNVFLDYASSSLSVSWKGRESDRPYFFCNVNFCDNTFMINIPDMRSFDFFPGRDDTVVFAWHNGVYVAELDNRSNQNTSPLITDPLADVLVYDREHVMVRDIKGQIFRAILE